MHQTQTFVHLTILLLPRARLTPPRTQPVKSMGVTMFSKIRIAIRPTAGSRHGSEESSKTAVLTCPKSETPGCLRLQRGNQTHARSQRNRRRGAYEIVRLEKHAPSPRCRLCSGDLFISVVSLSVQRPKPWAVATDGPKRTRSNRSPTRRNGSQPRELGRQCDLSCRSGAGGGHGSRLFIPKDAVSRDGR